MRAPEPPCGDAFGTAIGCDIESVARFTAKITHERFLTRVYAPQEIAYCLSRRDPAPHLAARFCAKEACVKALRSLWPDAPALRLNAIEVVRLAGRAPTMRLHDEAFAGIELQVSLSHAESVAMAVVLARRSPRASHEATVAMGGFTL